DTALHPVPEVGVAVEAAVEAGALHAAGEILHGDHALRHGDATDHEVSLEHRKILCREARDSADRVALVGEREAAAVLREERLHAGAVAVVASVVARP